MAITPASLTTGEDSDGGATVSTASVTPTANASVYLWLGWSATNCRVPPTVAGNGLTWTLVEQAMASGGSGSPRSTALFVAQGASPSAGAITVTFDGSNPATAASWCVFELQGAHVGAAAADAVIDVKRIHTGSNTNSLVTSSLKPQNATNALVHCVMAGANGQTVATEGGSWSKVNGHIGSSSLFSLGVFYIEDDTDTHHTASWTTSSSYASVQIEVRDGDTSTSVRPLRFHEVPGGVGDAGNAVSVIIGRWSIPDLATTSGSAVVTSDEAGQETGTSRQLTFEERGFFAGLVGCTITGTNIPASTTISSVDHAGQLTLSQNCTGTGTAANCVIEGIPLAFTSGRNYLLAVASRRTGDPSAPTSVAGSTVTFTKVTDLTYNTDWKLSLWKFECSSTVSETLTITWAASQSGGSAWALVEVEGGDTDVVTANVVTDTGAAVTSLDAAMGAYAQDENGVIYVLAGHAGGHNGTRPTAQGLADFARVDGELSVFVGNNNIANPDAVFSSDTVGVIGAEIIAAVEAAATATRLAKSPGRGGDGRAG